MPTIYYFWLDLVFSVSWCILTIKDSNRRAVIFIYSYNVYFHLIFTSLVLLRKQIFSLQFCKGHISVNVIRYKCNFDAVTIFRCGPKSP